MKKVIVAILCLTIICSLTACVLVSADNAVTDEDAQKYGDDAFEYAEEVAKEYIRLYQNKEFERVGEMTVDPIRPEIDFFETSKINGFRFKEIPDHLYERYTGTPAEYAEALYYAVKESFGENAWDNLSYRISREKHWDGTPVYYNTLTGKYVSLEECQQTNDQYFRDASGEEDVSMEYLFSKYPEEMKTWIENIPVKSDIEEAFAVYLVELFFNGKQIPDTIGIGWIQFSVSNKNGRWEIYSGITGGFDDYSPDVEE